MEELKLERMLDGRNNGRENLPPPVDSPSPDGTAAAYSNMDKASSVHAQQLRWLPPFPAPRLELDLQWYVDPGRGPLVAEYAIPPGEVPDHGRSASVVGFKGGVLARDVVNLSDNTLYKSTGNTYVGEFFMVRHALKRVFLFTTSLSQGDKHTFQESTVQKVVDSLELQIKGYKLVLVYVRSNHLGGDTGLRFSPSDESALEGKGFKALSLKEMQATGCLKDVRSYVVKANYYNEETGIIPEKVREYRFISNLT
jgi:hypothetical protein